MWLSYQIRRARPGVFFSPGFNPPPVCSVPFVFTIHDLIHMQSPAAPGPAKRLYYEWVLKPACRRAFRVLTVSEYSRAEILKWSRIPDGHVINVGNGVDVPFEPAGPRYEPGFPYIVSVGNLRPHKNLDRLFEAFRRMRCPDLRLLLVAPSGIALESRLRHLGLRHRIRIIAGVRDEELAGIYRGALLLVVPSLLEGFGLPALEAMACGTPVVVSRAAALPEVVGNAGVYADPLDSSDLQRGMERVLGDAGRREAMRAAGIERARLFSWDAVAARVRAILEAAAH